MLNRNYDEKLVVKAISGALQDFYDSLIKSIDGLDLSKVLRKKDPYLYRAKAMNRAEDIVEAILSAYVSSSEETIFGNVFFEPIAKAVTGGQKALAEGIDLMVEDKVMNTVHAIAVKSGPNVFNADSKKRQEENFIAASKLAKQGRYMYDAIIGYSYGRKHITERGKPKIYRELYGQEFWYELTGDKEFYKKIIKFMGDLPEINLKRYQVSYDRAKNRLLKPFMEEFCNDDGSINWDRLVAYNSRTANPKRYKDL